MRTTGTTLSEAICVIMVVIAGVIMLIMVKIGLTTRIYDRGERWRLMPVVPVMGLHEAGLANRSRAPHRTPRATPPEVVAHAPARWSEGSLDVAHAAYGRRPY